MSTYRLKCSDCGNVFDVQVTLQEREEAKAGQFACPKCHSENASQEFSMANFFKNVFEGSDEAGGCCSDKNSCDIGCAPKKGGGSCCG